MEINYGNIKEINLTSRGSFIVIDLTTFGFENELMVAKQNYLGGGMLGKVFAQNSIQHSRDENGKLKNPFVDENIARKLDEIADKLKRYLFEKTNPESEWESQTYEQNQKMPISGY